MNRDCAAVIVGVPLFVALSLVHLNALPLITRRPTAASIMLAVLAPYVAAFLAAAVTGYRAGGQPTTLVLTQLVLLGVLLSISGAFLNVGAFYVGLPVDFVEWAGTGVLALLSLPFYLGLGLTGGILGAWLNPSRDPGTMHAA